MTEDDSILTDALHDELVNNLPEPYDYRIEDDGAVTIYEETLSVLVSISDLGEDAPYVETVDYLVVGKYNQTPLYRAVISEKTVVDEALNAISKCDDVHERVDSGNQNPTPSIA